MTTLFTIGYEGVDIENWVKILKQHGITLVIDVREKPISRKKGFSKQTLNCILKDNGINYLHMGILGSPADIRNELHETSNYPLFFKKYLGYLYKQPGAINYIVQKANNQKCTCLMCFEKDPLKCHRSVITDFVLAKYPYEVEVEHL